jgi:hypothetical protein
MTYQKIHDKQRVDEKDYNERKHLHESCRAICGPLVPFSKFKLDQNLELKLFGSLQRTGNLWQPRYTSCNS